MLLLVGTLAVSQSSLTPGDWKALTVPTYNTSDGEVYILPPDFTRNPGPIFTQADASSFVCPLEHESECDLYTPNSNPFDPDPATSLCDCHSAGYAWRRQELTEAEYLLLTGDTSGEDDDLSDTSPVQGRCNPVAFGWTWDTSPQHTVPIVMTMDPGNTQQVRRMHILFRTFARSFQPVRTG